MNDERIIFRARYGFDRRWLEAIGAALVVPVAYFSMVMFMCL